MNPRNLPRGLRVGRGEDLEPAGRVGGNDLVTGRAHRRIDGVARAQGLAAALACTVAGIERVRAVHVRLHRALVFGEQAVADRERRSLVELDGLLFHGTLHDYPHPIFDATVPSRLRIASAVGPLRRTCDSRSSSYRTRSALRSRKVSCSSSSLPASSKSCLSDPRVIARPPRPAMTVYPLSTMPESALRTPSDTIPPKPTARHFSSTTTRL